MTNNKSILSTKKLTKTQETLVLNAGLSLAHYDILRTNNLSIDLSQYQLENVIITSMRSIPAIAAYQQHITNLYVVGPKTASQLTQLGFNVVLIQPNARQLAQSIITTYPSLTFTYICGIDRRDELPQALISTQINFKEAKVYQTEAVEKSFDCIFDAVLFYSPRGVHAFAKANPNKITRAICIGATTATAARAYTEQVIIAHKTTVENTIVTAVKELLND